MVAQPPFVTHAAPVQKHAKHTHARPPTAQCGIGVCTKMTAEYAKRQETFSKVCVGGSSCYLSSRLCHPLLAPPRTPLNPSSQPLSFPSLFSPLTP
jgi:hypothetical protein